MMSVWMRIVSTCGVTRPSMIAPRLVGATRKRSMTPRSRSSITPMPLQPPANMALMTTMPGVRNEM